MDFEVLIDSSLLELGIADGIAPVANKWLLSIVNDYEDGKWRHQKFDDFIWNNIAESALTGKEREILRNQPQSLLRNAAKNLRLAKATDDAGRGSELAEIVLYGIMRHRYNALPVVPKIFYKQNTNDFAKGADSVHIVLGCGNDFSLWFGEAKFYSSIKDTRLDKVIESVRCSLSTDKLKKENSIIVNLSELDDLGLAVDTVREIKAVLDNRRSIDLLKPRINVPILLLHECTLTANAHGSTPTYLDALRNYHKDRATAYFRKQVAALRDVHKYSDICFHLILFPVPQKRPIVERFVNSATFIKG
jgi:hypothetical protein